MSDRFDGAQTWFHWTNGTYFQRQRDGAVTVAKFVISHDNSAKEWEFTIPADEWASIVASVSAKGEVDGRWQVAREFHAGMR